MTTTDPFIEAARAEAERAVRELHEPGMAYRLIDGEDFAQEPDGDVCKVCGDYYPCDTIQALDSARAARRDEETR